MNEYFFAIEQWFETLATTIPLPGFVFVASGLEELFSIIPSSLVMGVAGSAALINGGSIFYLMGLAFLGNIARLLGAYIYYWIGDKVEDILVPYTKRYFGIGHEEIEGIGRRFKGHHMKDGTILFFMRATPFFPVTVTSIACGVIKMNIKVYLVASFLGSFTRDFLFLFVGYMGLASLPHIWRSVLDYKSYVDFAIAIIIVAILVYLYVYRGQGRRFLSYCRRWWIEKNS
jgi:membrane protein DedA with SNARE-associated domain